MQLSAHNYLDDPIRPYMDHPTIPRLRNQFSRRQPVIELKSVMPVFVIPAAMKSPLAAVSAKMAPFVGFASIFAAIFQTSAPGVSQYMSIIVPVALTIFVALVGVVYHDLNRRANENKDATEKNKNAIEALTTVVTEIRTAIMGIGPGGQGGLIEEVRHQRESNHRLTVDVQKCQNEIFAVTSRLAGKIG